MFFLIMKDSPDITTRHLIIHPLDKKELFDFVFLKNKFKKESGLEVPFDIINPELEASLSDAVFPHMNKHKNYLFYTLWLLILKSKKQVAGIFCMKGEPDEQGEVEIGYSIVQQFRNMGLMTETLHAMMKWFQHLPAIKKVKAETLSDNYASMRVLEKTGFRFKKSKGDYLIWELLDYEGKLKKSI